jgi:AcrR family transcriptional regulator
MNERLFIYAMAETSRKNLAVDERREMIFRHASQVFAAKGFAGSKIADIAAAAGMSQGLLYRHFASKDELFTELIASSFAKLIAAAEALERMPMPAHEKIVLALQRILAGMASDPAFSERVLLIAQASISEQIPEATKAVIVAQRDKPYAVIARIMAAGQAQGTILPGAPEVLAMLFWTMVKGMALHKVAFGEQFSVPDSAILCRMFLAPAKP